MRVACGLSLLTSATALCYQVVLGHRSCVARVNPAMARLAKPMAFGQWRSGNGDPDLLQTLDAIEPTLSYQGWHKDVAEIEERYIQGLVPSEAFCELRRKQERHDARSCCGSKSWASSKQRSTTMAGKTRQPSIEEKLGRDVVPRTYTPVWVMDQMRRRQQVHDRRLTRSGTQGGPVPLDEIEDETEPL